jgi:hypothetical protein
MCCLPVGTGAVVIVGEHLVVMYVHPSEQGAAGGAAHRRRDVRVAKLSATFTQ